MSNKQFSILDQHGDTLYLLDERGREWVAKPEGNGYQVYDPHSGRDLGVFSSKTLAARIQA